MARLASELRRRRLAARWRFVLAIVLGVAASGCFPGLIIPEHDVLRDVHLRGSSRVPMVALTFDDGPNGRCTEATLDALAAAHAPATFFVLGVNVATGHDDALLARMSREGHRIALHGWGHGLRQGSTEFAARDLGRGLTAVKAAVARAGAPQEVFARLYRPPFGVVTAPLARAAHDAGLAIVLWTISVGDWRSDVTPDEVAARILDTVGPGDVIVLHDGANAAQRSRENCVDRPNAAAVVSRLVPALRARGLEPAPLVDVLGLEPGS